MTSAAARRLRTTTAPAPFDLDASRAARTEALGEPFAFTSHGETYTMVPPKEWPVQVTAMLAEGDLVGALRGLLGDDQADSFLAGGTVTMGDLEALFAEVARWAGVESVPN